MRWKARFSLVVVLLLIFLAALMRIPAPAFGQTGNQAYLPLIFNPPEPPAWIGPEGGVVAAVTARGGVVYLGTWGSGVYKSTDGGASWEWKSAGLGNPYIGAIAMDPDHPQIAYAGTRGAGLYKTVDGGETWFPANNGIAPYRQVYAIAIDPHDGENILISTRSVTPEEGHPPWYGIVYRSTDQGNTWSAHLTDVGGNGQRDWAYGLAISFQNPRLVYAATHEHYLWRNPNFGNKTWTLLNSGITDYSTRSVVVNPLSVEPNLIVYTATWIDGAIFRSNNGGETWFQTGSAPDDAHILGMAIDPDGHRIYAGTFGGPGVLRTTDGGNTWHTAGLGGMDIPAIAIDAQNPNIVYSGTDGQGIFKSTDYGASWAQRTNGLHAVSVSDVAVSFADSQTLFAGVEAAGVQRSADGGESWESLGSGLDSADVLALAASPAAQSRLYALTGSDGLYRCNLDNIAGDCWVGVPINFPLAAYRHPALARRYPFNTLPFPDDGLPALAPTATTAKPALNALAFAPSNPQTAYLATGGAGVYKSLDGGASWNAAGLDGQEIVALAISPADENLLFAASPATVWQSSDGGASWVDTGFTAAEAAALALDAAGSLYAGASDGVYRYQSGGWAHLALSGLPVNVLILRPDKTGWLYAGTPDGLRISRNSGASWNPGPAVLNGVFVNALTLDPADPRRIYVSARQQGILRMQDSR